MAGYNNKTIADALTVFGEKSQANDNIESLKSSLNSILRNSLLNFIDKGSLESSDFKNILGNTGLQLGADFGGGWGLDLGINTPSPVRIGVRPEDRREDYRFTLRKSFAEGGKVSDIDWNFISELEGGSQAEGYIPTKDNKVIGKSGLTIGTGWDVGQMSLKELESSGLPSKLIDKVKPFVGLKGENAQAKLKELGAPSLEDDEASIIDAFTHNKALSQISKNYEKASGESFEDLSPAQQTTLASVGFQYGSNLKKVTPGFWEQVTSGDWEGAQENLMNFGDIYGTRREKEAGLLEEETIANLLAEKEN